MRSNVGPINIKPSLLSVMYWCDAGKHVKNLNLTQVKKKKKKGRILEQTTVVLGPWI